MALPFLPGNSFDKNLGKTKFHKSHFFDYNADVPVEKKGPDGELSSKNKSVYPKGVGNEQPAWIAFDRQVLRFYAYYQEGVEEKREEQFRIRNCVILFYLEDDSIQVNEKYSENSGIPQGTLIRRHRIPLPPPNDDQYYTVEHFNLDQRVQFYSKTFQITGCDGFTENFLRKLGVRLTQPSATPSDPYSEYRDKMLSAMQPQRPYERLDTLKQFLDYDRKVLRFYCLWDNTNSMFGDQHELVLHYYLADDTIEILEKVPPNSGRDAVPVFLKRDKLPKNIPNVNQPGVQTKRTVLNVFGPSGNGSRYILDALKTGEVHIDYYHDNDLVVGSYINAWGRNILLCDCDEFTKAFYRSKYNVGSFQTIKFPEETPREVKPELPPYNGFGSEEDSLSSYYSLIPKPPHKDHVKFMQKDRSGLSSNILRFIAHLKTTKSVDSERKFIIYYHLCDDTIAIFEPPVRNSGVIGGMFLERGRIAKPKSNASDTTIYYQPEDLYIGAEVAFNNFHFYIIDADEYALRYMEEESHQFPHANIELILAKLRGPATVHVDQIKAAFKNADTNNNGLILDDQFRILVKTLAQGLLNEHEVLTLSRKYKEKKDPPLSSLIKIVHADLKRLQFTQFSEVQKALQSSDIDGTGFISKDQLQHICHLVKLPLADQLVQGIMENCDKDVNKRVSYNQFVDLLNWVDYPVTADKPKDTKTVQMVNYVALIKDLTSTEN